MQLTRPQREAASNLARVESEQRGRTVGATFRTPPGFGKRAALSTLTGPTLILCHKDDAPDWQGDFEQFQDYYSPQSRPVRIVHPCNLAYESTSDNRVLIIPCAATTINSTLRDLREARQGSGHLQFDRVIVSANRLFVDWYSPTNKFDYQDSLPLCGMYWFLHSPCDSLGPVPIAGFGIKPGPIVSMDHYPHKANTVSVAGFDFGLLRRDCSQWDMVDVLGTRLASANRRVLLARGHPDAPWPHREWSPDALPSKRDFGAFDCIFVLKAGNGVTPILRRLLRPPINPLTVIVIEQNPDQYRLGITTAMQESRERGPLARPTGDVSPCFADGFRYFMRTLGRQAFIRAEVYNLDDPDLSPDFVAGYVQERINALPHSFE